MVRPVYVPRRGDYLALTLDPQAGHEQRGRRPVLVVSTDEFNVATNLAIVCPLTTKYRDYPFRVAVSDEEAVTGYVMVEQVKSLDYRERNAKLIGKASWRVMDEVMAKLDACIFDAIP